jgi:hypothetical protein
MSEGLDRGERATVAIKDEDVSWDEAFENDEIGELEVFDHVTVMRQTYVNSVNGYETYVGKIAGGDDPHLDKPEAVTERVADLLWHEFGIDGELEERGIRVVDMSSENVREA